MVALTRPHRTLVHQGVVAGLFFQLSLCAAGGAGAWIAGRASTGATPCDLTIGIVILVVATITASIGRWWQMWILHVFPYSFVAYLRVWAFESIARIAPRWILGRRTGDVAGTVMGDVEVSERVFAHIMADYVVAAVIAVLLVTSLVFIHPGLAIAVALLAIALATVPYWLSARAERDGIDARHQLASLNSDVIDGVQGLRELVSYAGEERYAARLADRIDALQTAQLAYTRRVALERAALRPVLLPRRAHRPRRGDLGGRRRVTPRRTASRRRRPDLYALAPLVEVTQTVHEMGTIRASAGRIMSILNHPPAIADTTTTKPNTNNVWNIEFDDVTFAYNDGGPEALRRVSFSVEPGEVVALVGHSGAGKSTCSNLLLRFWDPTSGAVRLASSDLRDWPADEVRASVAVVPQDVYLFNTTIRENIRLARPDASDHDVEVAARTAIAHDFISELPDQYDTLCGEQGAELSGGQRQRIAIARAILKDAPVLVMDEAVSNLDTVTEQQLSQAMANASAKRTTLLIAHRLSTVRAADRIVVLCEGEGEQVGTYPELASVDGAFRDVFATTG